MKTGLLAFSVPAGYTVSWLVGYVEQESGDEYSFKGRRILSIDSRTPEECIATSVPKNQLSHYTESYFHRLNIIEVKVPGPAWEELVKP